MKYHYVIAMIASQCINLNSPEQQRISHIFELSDKPSLTLDYSEADQALAILTKENAGQVISDTAWTKLFSTIPYQRLQQREAAYHNPFSNDDFKKFLESPDMIGRTSALSKTLNSWKNVDFNKIAQSDISYLPKSAVLKASVFPLIKPGKNSFVYGQNPDKAIFLYLNPDLSREQFANKVAHEAHHIGMSSIENDQNKLVDKLTAPQKAAFEWLGGFGEGEAMLAAAGSPTSHPHCFDSEAVRRQWDQDMLNFNRDLPLLQQFYQEILDRKLQGDEQIQNAASPFYGTQGPFYTVGYKMCQLIELHFGRSKLVEAFADPRQLLVLYNKVAKQENKKNSAQLVLWSQNFIEELY